MRQISFMFFIVILAAQAFSSGISVDKTVIHENGIANGIGAGGTFLQSWGFLYRRHFNNGFGFSTSAGGWFDGYSGHMGNGLGLLYSVAHHQINWSAMPNASVRVYLTAVIGNIYRLEHSYHYTKIDDKKYESENRKHLWDTGLGAGPGVEFFFNKYFSLHLELPWMTFMRLEDKSFKFRDSHPYLGGGFVYYF